MIPPWFYLYWKLGLWHCLYFENELQNQILNGWCKNRFSALLMRCIHIFLSAGNGALHAVGGMIS